MRDGIRNTTSALAAAEALRERAARTGPFGVLGVASIGASQGSITTEVDVTSLTQTWTAVAGRRYRLYAEVFMSTSVAGDQGVIKITTSANVQVQSSFATLDGAAGQSTKLACTAILSGLSGSVTYKVRAVRGSGTGNLSVDAGATFPAYFILEDIGAG